MNEHDIFGIIAFVVLCAGVAVLLVIRNRQLIEELERKRAAYPTTWIHIGVPPKGVETALVVIKDAMPTWTGRYGGTIEWVKDPFLVNGVTLAAGTVQEFEEPRIKLMYNADVTKTALAHELHHVWQARYEKLEIWDGDPLLYAWVYETNNKIRTALSSIG